VFASPADLPDTRYLTLHQQVHLLKLLRGTARHHILFICAGRATHSSHRPAAAAGAGTTGRGHDLKTVLAVQRCPIASWRAQPLRTTSQLMGQPMSRPGRGQLDGSHSARPCVAGSHSACSCHSHWGQAGGGRIVDAAAEHPLLQSTVLLQSVTAPAGSTAKGSHEQSSGRMAVEV
jgi:hypothetical protein